jgi:hypothetical protein
MEARSTEPSLPTLKFILYWWAEDILLFASYTKIIGPPLTELGWVDPITAPSLGIPAQFGDK